MLCKSCGLKSDKYDSFMDLSLDVAHSQSVPAALKTYTQVEVLDVNNKYECAGSGGKPHMACATKQLTINAAPLVLTIQLKRFEYVRFGRGKLDQFIMYPVHLDVSAAGLPSSARHVIDTHFDPSCLALNGNL